LAICLCSEFLLKIGKQISIFRHEAIQIVNNLMHLGQKIVENVQDDKVEKMYLDVDFRDRTVLKIITMNDFALLMGDEKVAILLDEIWVGKNTYECDGRVSEFSMLTYLAKAPIKKLPGKKISLSQLLSNNFKVSIDEEKFWYQYKFRHISISYIFLKDFLCCAFMVGLFQYINFQYLSLF